jgi:glycosyltransferase involved in cell wall biosynthesis
LLFIQPMKIIICLNTAWNLFNFRAGLIRALVAEGYEVLAVAPFDDYAVRLSALGCRFVALPMDNQGTNPWRDALLLFRFWRLLRREQPAAFLGYTVKPNIYGSLAAQVLGISVINNIAGLGAVFIRKGWLVRVVRALYRAALKHSRKVFFQNEDDRRLFIDYGLVNPAISALLPGSGVDLKRFLPVDEVVQKPQKGFRFLLIARMLRDKGVGEFVEAARLLRQEGLDVECCLLGFLDVQNPAAISRVEMEAWVASGDVRYLGVSDDVRTEIAEADCVVLPSYREGTPRTLLEAAAMGKPIVTTDAVGCREAVDDGVNGFLCKVRDAADLSRCMKKMLALDSAQRAAMGAAGRRKMEQQFDEKIVVERYLEALRAIV